MQPLTLPDDFILGSATSPIQVEGEIISDWKDFVARDGSRPDNGPNHWRRYRFDFRCLSDMNLKAYRLGFDWARLQRGPRAEFDREVMFRYLEMLAELRGYEVEPFLSLFDFSCPMWLANRGGWLADDAPDLFADFVDRVAIMTDGEVRHWITVHEPMLYALMAYVIGEFPPRCSGSRRQCMRALANLQRGHALAYEAIKSHYPDAEVGFAKHCMHFSAERAWHPLDRVAARAADKLFNHWGIDRFARTAGSSTADFMFVNFHGARPMQGLKHVSPITGFGPEVLLDADNGIGHADTNGDFWLNQYLRQVRGRTGLPVYVAARGPEATDEDAGREHLARYLRFCLEAGAGELDVRGFFYMPLLDCFDWRHGLSRRQGLLAVNFSDRHRRRDMRPLARFYGSVAGGNGARGGR